MKIQPLPKLHCKVIPELTIQVNAERQKDHVDTLAKSDPKVALSQARKRIDPWSRALGLSWVARFTDENPISITCEAAKAACECDDDYKKSAISSWEVAALAERGFTMEARKCLRDAVTLGKSVQPISSRSEALRLLFQAAFRIGRDEAEYVYGIIKVSCPIDEHWRCKRAVRDGEKMLAGQLDPLPFFCW